MTLWKTWWRMHLMAELDLNVNVKTKGTKKLNGIGSTLAGVGKVGCSGWAAVGWCSGCGRCCLRWHGIRGRAGSDQAGVSLRVALVQQPSLR